MACTRAQSALQKRAASSAPKDQGRHPQGVRKRKSTARVTRLQQRLDPGLVGSDSPCSSPTDKTPSRQGFTESGQRGTKRPVDTDDYDLNSLRKRPRRSPSPVKDTSDRGAAPTDGSYKSNNQIEFWARECHWPQEYFEPDMEHLLARKKSLSSLGRKRSNSATSTTPSDQKPREEKSAPYRNPQYELVLNTKGTFMKESKEDISDASKLLCRRLLDGEQDVPKESVFDDAVFRNACQKLQGKNEARVIQDISRLIIPSAETLALRVESLECLVESVNEGWNNSIPLTGTRPQPDYSVGFGREAFTEDQLTKLSPFLGDFLFGDQSYFMGTYYMYFPFLSCEVKCGAAALDVADRQNAHSMTLAVRGITELFRAVKREDEVHRQILAFSVSHDHRSVRIYGHYPVIEGKETKYYRHPIREFSFTELDGKDKWAAYRFTKNVYDLWMPTHFKRICSAIDQLPSDLDFDAPPLQESGLSQSLESHHLSQADATSVSASAKQDSQSSDVAQPKDGTQGTSFTDPGAKRRKGRK